MLAKERASLTARHADKKRCFPHVDFQAKRCKTRDKKWDHTQRLKKFCTCMENSAQQEIVRVDLHVVQWDQWFKLVSDVTSKTSPNQWRQHTSLPHSSLGEHFEVDVSVKKMVCGSRQPLHYDLDIFVLNPCSQQ